MAVSVFPSYERCARPYNRANRRYLWETLSDHNLHLTWLGWMPRCRDSHLYARRCSRNSYLVSATRSFVSKTQRSVANICGCSGFNWTVVGNVYLIGSEVTTRRWRPRAQSFLNISGLVGILLALLAGASFVLHNRAISVSLSLILFRMDFKLLSTF